MQAILTVNSNVFLYPPTGWKLKVHAISILTHNSISIRRLPKFLSGFHRDCECPQMPKTIINTGKSTCTSEVTVHHKAWLRVILPLPKLLQHFIYTPYTALGLEPVLYTHNLSHETIYFLKIVSVAKTLF